MSYISEEEKKKKKARRKRAKGVMLTADIIGLLALVIALFFGVRIVTNLVFLDKYNKGEYDAEIEKRLVGPLNIVEDYLPYYNMGNAAYKNEDYDEAIADYRIALEKNPPKYLECPVRINLALSMIKKINFENLSTEKKILNAIRQLQAARNVLCEDGCANPDYVDGAKEQKPVKTEDGEEIIPEKGHSDKAEQLKKEIDEAIKFLEDMLNQNSQSSQDNNDGQQPQQPKQDDNQDKQDNGGSNQDREDEIRDKLNDQKEDAMGEKADAEQQRENEASRGQGSGSPDFNGKTW